MESSPNSTPTLVAGTHQPGTMAPNAPVYWPHHQQGQPDHPPYRASAPYPAYPHRSVTQYRKPTVAKPFRPIEILVSIGIVVASDIALVTGSGEAGFGGVGFGVLLVVLPALLFIGARAWRFTPRLAIVTALLAIVAVRSVYSPSPLLVLSGLGLAFAFGLVLRARRVFVPEAFLSAIFAIGKIPSRISAASRGVALLAERTKVGKINVLPIVIPCGLVVVFMGVFALANPVVAHGLDVVWTYLTSVITFPSPGRVFLWAFALLVGAVLLRPALKLARGRETKVHAPDAIIEATPTSLLIARNALIALNVLFLGYNAIDARYLWAGSPPSGMPTQQYAHEGAFWLTVALVLLTIVIGVMFRGALGDDRGARAKQAKMMAYAWMAQGLILALGTYRRIAIHIAKSGLSDLRIVGILGTTLVVSGVVIVALKLRNAKTFTWLVRRQLDAFAITLIMYALVPTHLISAKVNVARVNNGEYRPILHSFRQSHETESAAQYVPLLDHPDARVRQGIAGLLSEELANLRDEKRAGTQATWRQRNLAFGDALAALEAAEPKIRAELGARNPRDTKRVLLEISQTANKDKSLEEILAIPGALEENADTRSNDVDRH